MDTISNIANLVISRDSKVLNMVKDLITNPTLICLNPPFVISLEVEQYDKNGQAEVSQHPVIVPGTGVKQYLNDNVAPQPYTWNLGGYIPGNQTVEKTNLYTPIVEFNTDMLWLAYERGAIMTFKDVNQKRYDNVVIENLSTSYRNDCMNKRPFSMTLKEIKVIKASIAELTEEEKNALPKGNDADAGTTQTKNAAENGTYYNPLGGDAEYDDVHRKLKEAGLE